MMVGSGSTLPLRARLSPSAPSVWVVIDSMPNDPGEPLPPSPADGRCRRCPTSRRCCSTPPWATEVAGDIRLLRTRNLMLAQAIAAEDAGARHSDGTLMGVTPYIVVSPGRA